jgi:hypothetical protein
VRNVQNFAVTLHESPAKCRNQMSIIAKCNLFRA